MEVEKVMAIGIIGSVIGLAVLITAVVLLVREKNDKESKKIYSAIVKNKIKYSKYVLQNDYYGTVFGKK